MAAAAVVKVAAYSKKYISTCFQAFTILHEMVTHFNPCHILEHGVRKLL
jgi:hypothetical protein